MSLIAMISVQLADLASTAAQPVATTADKVSLNFDAITNAVLQLVAALILAVGGMAITKLTAWAGIKKDSAARAALDDVLQKAVIYGLQQTQERIKTHGWDDVEVKRNTITAALPYVISRFPDVLKSLNMDMSDQAGLEDRMRGALERAFPGGALVASQSPVTPPKTAPVPQEQAGIPAMEAAIAEGNAPAAG